MSNNKKKKTGGKKTTNFAISVNDLVLDVRASNAGEKLTGKNMLFFFIKSSWLIVVIIIFVTTGTLNTLLYKFQNESHSKFGTMPPMEYTHPWTQSFQMFLGMMICCLLPHYLRMLFLDRLFSFLYKKYKEYRDRKAGKKNEDLTKYDEEEDYNEQSVVGIDAEEEKILQQPINGDKNFTTIALDDSDEEKLGEGKGGEEKKEEEKKPPINQLLYIAPGLCDCIASTILSVALILTYASIYQMLQCVTVVFTFLLSITVLSHNFYKFPHKWIGVALVLLGSVLVGLNTVIYPQGAGQATAKSPALGALLVVVSCFIYALFYIFEEIFLVGYDTDPLEVPGFEGFWGIILVVFVLFFCYWVPGNDYYRLENFPAAVVQTFTNWELLIWCFCLVGNIGFYNLMGNVITLNISCATRSVLDQLRACIIWLIQMIRGRQEFTWLQLAGFLILVIGVAIYNEVLFNFIVPCYTKWCQKIEKKDKKSGRGALYYFAFDLLPEKWRKWIKEGLDNLKKKFGKNKKIGEGEDKKNETSRSRSDSVDSVGKKPRSGRNYSMDQKDFDGLGLDLNPSNTPLNI